MQYVVDCCASAEGMLSFSEGRWHRLTQFRLWTDGRSSCTRIGSIGCKYLSRADLPSIEEVTLCIDALDQSIAQWEQRAWGTFRRRSGGACGSCGYVVVVLGGPQQYWGGRSGAAGESELDAAETDPAV